MARQSVAVEDFQDHLNDYIASDAPVAIVRDGQRVGLFIPERKRPTSEDRAALRKASEEVKAMMDAAGLSEEQIYAEIDAALLEEKRARRAAL